MVTRRLSLAGILALVPLLLMTGPSSGTNEGATPLPAIVTSIAISPDGSLLATGGDDHAVRIWDAASNEVRHELRGHTDWVHAISFDASGTRLYSAAADGRILVWDVPHGRLIGQLYHQRQPIAAMTQVPGLGLAIVGFAQPLRIIDCKSGEIAQEMPCPCQDMRGLALSPNQKLLAAGGRNGHIRVWSLPSGTVTRDIAAHNQRLRSIVFSPAGDLLISGGEDRAICAWDVSTGTEVCHIGESRGKVLAMTMLDDSHLAAASSDNRIHIWQLPTGQHQVVLEGHTGSVSALATRDGRLISGGYDATVRIWEKTEWQRTDPGTPVSRVLPTSPEASTIR